MTLYSDVGGVMGSIQRLITSLFALDFASSQMLLTYAFYTCLFLDI